MPTGAPSATMSVMGEWIERLIEQVENVVYLAVAVILFGLAGVVIGKTALAFGDLGSGGVIETSAEILDLLLLVFIVVELLFAVRTTLARRELVAEPFLLVGIIASIKEIVVLSVKAPDLLGKPEFADTLRLMGLLTGTVIVLALASFLLRRKEREPSEGANSGNGEDEVERDVDGQDENAREKRASLQP
ncbi:hypothetical protein GCM10027080_24230 [Pedococcus soli]